MDKYRTKSTYPSESSLQHRGDAPSFVKRQARPSGVKHSGEDSTAASAQNGAKLRDRSSNRK